jgi:hypothetical protein
MFESKNRERIDEMKENRTDFVLMMVKLNFWIGFGGVIVNVE